MNFINIFLQAVVDALTNRVVTTRVSPQFGECLRRLVKEGLALLRENPTLLHELVEQLCTLGVVGARRVMTALLPIIKLNRTLKDSTILVLRKALFARSTEAKQIGINGVLQLLKVRIFNRTAFRI